MKCPRARITTHTVRDIRTVLKVAPCTNAMAKPSDTGHSYFGDTRFGNNVGSRCLFVFLRFVSKTSKFHIPRVGMEYGNAQATATITASTIAEGHSEKSDRVVGDVCRHARNCNIPQCVPSHGVRVRCRLMRVLGTSGRHRKWISCPS